MEQLLGRFGYWPEANELLAQHLVIAEAEGDCEAAVQIRLQQTKFLQLSGDFQAASGVLQPLCEGACLSNLSDRTQAMVLNSLGGVLQRLGRFQEAADALERSYTLLAEQETSADRRWS